MNTELLQMNTEKVTKIEETREEDEEMMYAELTNHISAQQTKQTYAKVKTNEEEDANLDDTEDNDDDAAAAGQYNKEGFTISVRPTSWYSCLRSRWCCCCSCCCWCFPCSWRKLQLGLILMVIAGGLLYFFIKICFLPPVIAPIAIEPLTTDPPVFNGTVRVLLVGDSMFGISCRRYGLREKIAAFLPQYSMVFAISGKSAVKARDLRMRLPKILPITNPDVVFLWENSDISNVNEHKIPADEVAFVRSNYSRNMAWSVEYILNYNSDRDTNSNDDNNNSSSSGSNQKTRGAVKKMALFGPGMLGEGAFLPRDPNLLSTWPEIFPVVQKYDHIEVIGDYIEMNKEIAWSFNIPHVDIKRLFEEVLPWYRIFYAGWVTSDGEHPNERWVTDSSGRTVVLTVPQQYYSSTIAVSQQYHSSTASVLPYRCHIA